MSDIFKNKINNIDNNIIKTSENIPAVADKTDDNTINNNKTVDSFDNNKIEEEIIQESNVQADNIFFQDENSDDNFCVVKLIDLVSSEVIENINDKNEKHYTPVLSNISLSIYESEIFAVSSFDEFEVKTLLKIIANITPYYSGRCILNEMGSMRKKRVIHEDVFYIDTDTMLYDNMTVLEYLVFTVGVYGNTNEIDLKEELLDFLIDLGLGYISLTLISYLSSEEKVIIELITALFSNSKLVVADLTNWKFSISLCNVISALCKSFRSSKKALVIGATQPSLIGISCDKLVLLQNGKQRFEGTLDELYHKGDHVLYVIKDNNLELIKNRFEECIPIYHYKIVENMLLVIKTADIKRDDKVFFHLLSLHDIFPESIKINKGRVQNSFEELLKIYDVN